MKNKYIKNLAMFAIVTSIGLSAVDAGTTCGKSPSSFFRNSCSGLFCGTGCSDLFAYTDMARTTPALVYCVDSGSTDGCKTDGSYADIYEFIKTGDCSIDGFNCLCSNLSSLVFHAHKTSITKYKGDVCSSG